MDYWLITQLHHCSEGELKYRGLSSFEVLSVNEYSLQRKRKFSSINIHEFGKAYDFSFMGKPSNLHYKYISHNFLNTVKLMQAGRLKAKRDIWKLIWGNPSQR